MQKAIAAASREITSSIQEYFKTGLADSISSMVGESVDVSSSADRGAKQTLLWFRFEFESLSEVYLAFGAPKELWFEIGSKVLGIADSEDPDTELVLSTLTEISAQVAGSLTSSLNYKYQRQLEVKGPQVGETSDHAGSDVQINSFHLTLKGSSSAIPVTLVFPEAFVEALLPAKAPEGAMESSGFDQKLELLMDVEMPVTVSIGRAQLPLKDVIKLTTGSVVELSRNVSDPVDIIVNNTLVARGDVVVVEGNFGVRIREVLSKEDRLKRFGSK